MKMVETTAKKMREIRLARGYSQKAVADRLGMDRSAYTCFEMGKSVPSSAVLEKLAKLFNVSAENFFAA